jgi:glutaredoxin
MGKRIGVAALAIAAALAAAGYSGSALAQGRAGEAQCGRTGVYVFTAHWCSTCKAVQAFLNEHHVPFKRIEVTGNREAIKYMRDHYHTDIIPVVVVDGDHMVGNDASWLAAKLCFGRPGDARYRSPPAAAPPAGPGPAGPPAGAASARSGASVGAAMEPMRAR